MPLTMIPMSRPFVPRVSSSRKYRGVTRVSPLNIDIMHSFDRAGFITTFFLSIFAITKMIDSTVDSDDSYDGDDDDYDYDDDDLIEIKTRYGTDQKA